MMFLTRLKNTLNSSKWEVQLFIFNVSSLRKSLRDLSIFKTPILSFINKILFEKKTISWRTLFVRMINYSFEMKFLEQSNQKLQFNKQSISKGKQSLKNSKNINFKIKEKSNYEVYLKYLRMVSPSLW